MTRTARVRLGTGLLAALAALPGCWTAALWRIPETHSAYDTLPKDALARLAAARKDLDAGDARAADMALAALCEEFPQNVPLGIWRQEAEIALEQSASAPSELRERYRKRAEDDPTVTNLVLAARTEPDPTAAGVLLERAEQLDPHCAWPSYGRAFLAARAGDWKEARDRIARAKFADPGHMPTLWLETWLLARSGGLSQAFTSLSTWIEHARGDPRLDQHLVLEAELDRALLAVLDGEPKAAKALLADLEGVPVDPARLRMIEAGAQQELGDATAALAAARQAELAKPSDILPIVQQALLHEIWLGDAAAAEADWARALELSRTDAALGSLLERVRARVRLERYAVARATAPAPAPAPANDR